MAFRITFEGVTDSFEPGAEMRVVGVLAIAPVIEKPAATTGLRLTALAADEVSIAWDAVAGATGYKVYRDDVLLDDVGVLVLTDSAVVAETRYVYTVLAYNSAGDAEEASDGLAVDVPAAELQVPGSTEIELIEVTSQRVDFQWIEVTNATGYKVYDGETLLATQTGTSYSHGGLTPESSHSYAVVAYNDAGDGSASAALEVTTSANAEPEWLIPDPNYTGTVGDAFSLDLNQLVNDSDGQTISISSVSGSVPGLSLSAGILSGVFTTEGSHNITVRADDGFDETDINLSFTIAAVADMTGPTAPVISVAAIGSTATVTLVTPSTDASGVKNYQIHRSTDGGSTYALRITKNEDEFPFSDLGLSNGAKYYKVRARDLSPNANLGDFSDAKVVTINVSAQAPDAPVNFSAVQAAAAQVSLTWEASSSGAPPDDYDMDFSSTSDSGPWTALTVGLQTSFVHDSLAPRTYHYRLKAKSGSEESDYATVSVTVSAPAEREVYYTGLVSGNAQGNTSVTNGATYNCKTHPDGAGSGAGYQGTGVNKFFGTTSAQGNGVTNADLDMRFVASETFDGVTVEPRAGSKFLRQVLYYDKEYECLNGANDDGDPPPLPSGTKDKPRIKATLSSSTYEHDWDREIWIGFSLYTHPNHFHDTGADRDHRGGGYHVWCNAGSGLTQWYLTSFLRPTSAPTNWSGGTGGNTEYWVLAYQRNPNNVADMVQAFNAKTVYAALGNRADDEGKWTDFVFRYRLNPFTTNTNASSVGGKNHVYEGNKGIFQVWKGTGPYLDADFNRQMVKVYDVFNAPVGGVPHATDRVGLDFGIYKYSWKKRPTLNDGGPGAGHGPGWLYNAKSSLRWGFRKAPLAGEVISQSGTKDVDVSPSGLALPGWSEQG